MSERRRKMDRIRRVQEQLQRAAEWELGRLQRKGAELEEAQETLIASLNGDDRLYGLFVDSAAKRLKALAAEAEKTEAERAVQADVTLERAMDVKRTERMVSLVREADRREAERKDLQEILEAIVARGGASPA